MIYRHCVKMSVFGVILFCIYKVSLCIQSECRKMRTRITPNTDTFYAVRVLNAPLGLEIKITRLIHRILCRMNSKIKLKTTNKEILASLFRRSHQICSLRKVALRDFAKFTGKHLCQSVFFNKVNFIKKETLTKLLRATSFTEHLLGTASVYC